MTAEVPRPLRLWPSLAGSLLAIAVGALTFGSICAKVRRGAHEVEGLLFVVVLWTFAAGCLYAANESWIGRDRQERAERFVLCLVLALPVLALLVLFGVSLYDALGGRM